MGLRHSDMGQDPGGTTEGCERFAVYGLGLSFIVARSGRTGLGI